MPLAPKSPGSFGSANGSAEAAAAGRYTGIISLLTAETPFPKPTSPPWNGTSCLGWPRLQDPTCRPQPVWNAVSPGPNGTAHGFSAVCWYTGKSVFEGLGGRVPVGLLAGSVGGSAIEIWLPPGDVNATDACGVDDPPCDAKGNLTDSLFYQRFIEPLAPFTLGAVVWDQGERDVHCFGPANNHTRRYPCLEHRLVSSWRRVFNSTFAFVTVQLPGYIGDCDTPNADPSGGASFSECVPGVFDMRVAQDAGVKGDPMAACVATYDLSCSFGVAPPDCPFGSVHNLRKDVVGARVAGELMRMLGLGGNSAVVTEGPRAVAATAARGGGGNWTVSVRMQGGTAPFVQRGTQNCAACCENAGGPGDFDVSSDGGAIFVNATLPKLSEDGRTAVVSVATPGRPTHVRYTANQGFPQCAVYNREDFPLFPFALAVASCAADQK